MPHPPPIPPPTDLDYRPRHAPENFRVPFFSLRVALILWVFGFFFLAFLLFGVARFEAIFNDFRVELPVVTKGLLWLSRWTMDGYGWLFLLPVIGVVPLGVGALLPLGVSDVESYTWRKRWATLFIVTLLIALALLVLWALGAPLLALMSAVSGSSGGLK
jgi:hypothetical protein